MDKIIELRQRGFSQKEICKKLNISEVPDALLRYIDIMPRLQSFFYKLHFLDYPVSKKEKKNLLDMLSSEELTVAFVMSGDPIFVENVEEISKDAISWFKTGEPSNFKPSTVLEYILLRKLL